MNGNIALRKFLNHLATAPEGARFEVGDMYDPVKGWRVYQRIGDVGLAMNAEGARDLVGLFERTAAEAKWRSAGAELREIFDQLKACAEAVDRKNREKVVPPDIPNLVRSGGRA